MSKTEHLMKQTFDNWNAVKRYQTKQDLERERGNSSKADYFELQMYKVQAKLELSLRALQGELRNNENTNDINDIDNHSLHIAN